MNCKEAQTQIAQFVEARPSPELMAHVRACENCRRALEELIQHQAWLRRQFAEVSARLLAEAPIVTEAALRDRLQRLPPPPSRGRPLMWAAALAAVVAIAGVTVWQTRHRQGAASPQASATNVVSRATQKPQPKPAKPAAAKPKTKQKSKLKATEKPDQAELDALEMTLKSSTPPSNAAGAKPPAVSEAEKNEKPMTADGPRTLAMVASAAVPTAGGSIVPAGQPGPDGVPTASTTMNLHGLAAQSAYAITGLNAAGQRIVLANFMTDASGAAAADLAAALSHAGPQAGADATALLRHLVVQDSAGNPILTVSSTSEAPTEPPP